MTIIHDYYIVTFYPATGTLPAGQSKGLLQNFKMLLLWVEPDEPDEPDEPPEDPPPP